jgi:DNA polymerase-1
MVAVCKENGLPIRRTASHGEDCTPGDDCHVSLDSDACKSCDDEILEAYADLSESKKVRSNDVEMLAGGVTYPISPRYDIAETGRTTCSKPNIQNLRRRVGIRECFRPRDGYVFAQADFPQLELYALAQYCRSVFGFSKLADALNAGLDPHLAVAADIVKLPYEQAAAEIETDAVDNARQTAKVFNFGKPGGLGHDKLIMFAKKAYGVELTREKAIELTASWLKTWSEMPRFFNHIGSLVDEDTGFATVESLFTKRFRGGARYCAACNSTFQGLGADCAKNAVWLVAKAQYADPSSPLFNTRTVAFVHDELIIEVPDDEHAADAAEELARLMVKGANAFLPDVPIPIKKMKPLLMRRWSKKAKQVRDASGRLVPWAP